MAFEKAIQIATTAEGSLHVGRGADPESIETLAVFASGDWSEAYVGYAPEWNLQRAFPSEERR